MSSLHK